MNTQDDAVQMFLTTVAGIMIRDKDDDYIRAIVEEIYEESNTEVEAFKEEAANLLFDLRKTFLEEGKHGKN
jgi:hypothetical protein